MTRASWADRANAALFGGDAAVLRALKALVPLWIRDAIVLRMMCTDRLSRRNLSAAFRRRLREPAAIRLRALGGEAIWIRPGTDDPWTVRETITYRDCLPPADVGDPDVVLDLGANIGTSMALLATEFPGARVIGVEPDPANAEMCRRNIRPWAARCELVEAAAWVHDGEVALGGDSSSARHVGDGGRKVRAVSLETLVVDWAGGRADFVKMDIEGAEADLLTRRSGWDAVACVSVEVHAPYTVDRCSVDLAALGFHVSDEPGPRAPRVVGKRMPSLP